MAFNGKVLVTYFSASKGKVTERLAKRFAELTDADLYEIVPEKPYSEDVDLIDAKLFSAFSDDEELIEWVGALSLS